MSRRSTKMGPGGSSTTNGSNYFFNKYNGGGIGASTISNRRAKNRFAAVYNVGSKKIDICASLVVGNDAPINMNTSGMTPITFTDDDDGYAYLPFTGMDFYFFGTNYGNSDGTIPTTSMYMSTNYAFGFGIGNGSTGWNVSDPAIVFDFFDSFNFASYVSPPQNGSISGVKYVRIVATGTDYKSSDYGDATIKKAYEIYYVRDNCFQYMQFNCDFEGGFDRLVDYNGGVSNISNGTAFQNTFGSFGANPPNNGGPQTGGSYVIRSDLNGDNWQFFPNMHLVL